MLSSSCAIATVICCLLSAWSGVGRCVSENRLRLIRDNAVKQNITIIRERKSTRVAEPVVQKQGAERIVVQLPVFKIRRKPKKS